MSALCAFEAAARHQNFTAAAAELNLTQSAVSRQIRQLESRLGAELFVRERQTVQLSAAGADYVREIRTALNRVSEATRGFRASGEGKTLNLGILPTFGTRWLAPRLPAFFAEHPGITVNLVTKSDPFEFQSESVDAAIHFGRPQWPGAELVFLMDETVAPICSPGLRVSRAFETAADLLAAPLLHLKSRPDAWSSWFASMGVDSASPTGMQVDQFAVAAEAASAGVGIALLPLFLIEEELERGELVLAIDAPVKSQACYYLAWPTARAQFGPLAAFRTWLCKTAGAEK